MSTIKRFNIPWEWWIRSGERILLGIGTRTLLKAATVTGRKRKEGISRVRQEVENGRPLVVSMKVAGVVLPAEVWCILETAEHTGRLGEGMCETGEILKRKLERRRELGGQLWYPCLVILVGICVMALILFWVVPQMQEVSESMGLGDGMPWLTENIGWLYGILFAGIFGSLALGFLSCAILHFLGRKYFTWSLLEEKLMGRLPVIGTIRRKLREAGILRQLGSLIHGGVTIPRALEMAAERIGGLWLNRELLNCRSRLLMGTGFEEAFVACPVFSRDSLPLIIAGQESGQLDTYMGRLSDDLERQVSWSLKNWTRMLEPILLLGLSGAIGGLVLAYLLPMVRMLEQAGGAF